MVRIEAGDAQPVRPSEIRPIPSLLYYVAADVNAIIRTFAMLRRITFVPIGIGPLALAAADDAG